MTPTEIIEQLEKDVAELRRLLNEELRTMQTEVEGTNTLLCKSCNYYGIFNYCPSCGVKIKFV